MDEKAEVRSVYRLNSVGVDDDGVVAVVDDAPAVLDAVLDVVRVLDDGTTAGRGGALQGLPTSGFRRCGR